MTTLILLMGVAILALAGWLIAEGTPHPFVTMLHLAAIAVVLLSVYTHVTMRRRR